MITTRPRTLYRVLRLLVILQVLVLPAYGQLLNSIDLAVQDVDFTVISRDGGDKLGSPNAMALGDFNGDGIIDLLLGAPGGDGPDDRRPDAGEAYIVFGRPDLPPSLDVDGVPGPDVIIFGRDPGDKLGSGVAAGDVNADGITDVILGAPGGDGAANIRDSVGEVVVIAGGSLPARIDLSTFTADLIVYNNRQRSRFGTVLQSADLNGDGIDDLFISDPTARGQAGSVYVIYGRADLPERLNIAEPDHVDVTIVGRDPGDQLGSALASGDLNNDGVADLVIGAPFGDGPRGERTDTGEAYMIFGGGHLPRVIELASISADVTLFGADPQDQLGSTLTTGDLNGDRVSDLLVGAPGGSGPSNLRGSAGEVYLVYGSSAFASVLDVAAGDQNAVIFGAEPLENLGSAVAAGDLDNDGLQDLILGAKGGRGPDGIRAGAGNVYVLRNSGLIPPIVDLGAGADLVVYGAEKGDALGSALAGADLTGTGEGILLMGAPGADSPANGPDAGSVYALRAADLIAPNQPPVAIAGNDQTVDVGSQVQLDGSASFDPDGDPLTFTWAFISMPDGSQAQLSDPTSPTPTFIADLSGEYLLELTVDDGRGETASDQVRITARAAGLKGDVDGDGKITILDARLVMEEIMGLRTLTQEQRERGDVAPPSGTLTIDDAHFIAEIVVGLRSVESSLAPLIVRSWRVLNHRGRLEFHALGVGIEALRVEVFDLHGRPVFRSGWVAGNSLFWRPLMMGAVPANGVYLYVLSARGEGGKLVRSEIQKLVLLR